MKTAELVGFALDWAVAKAMGLPVRVADCGPLFFGKSEWRAVLGVRVVSFSTDWAQGGPIIEWEEIGTKRRAPCMKGEEWEAMGSITAKGAGYRYAIGPTPLIAAMRCFVASKLGDEVEIPEALC